MESPEHERCQVSEYVELEAGDETVQHAEKIASEHVMGDEYNVWDVATDKNRWWVITNPTNLYDQSEFTSMDYVLSFHLGLMHRVFAKQARTARTDDEERERLRIPWRKWEKAAESSEEADEAEEFQAVGMQCREALLAFVRAVATDEMVPEGEEHPPKGNFLRWSDFIAARDHAGVSPPARLPQEYRRQHVGSRELAHARDERAQVRRCDRGRCNCLHARHLWHGPRPPRAWRTGSLPRVRLVPRDRRLPLRARRVRDPL